MFEQDYLLHRIRKPFVIRFSPGEKPHKAISNFRRILGASLLAPLSMAALGVLILCVTWPIPAMQTFREAILGAIVISIYSFGLAQRSAYSVQKYLVSQGFDPARITAISYGKENPVDLRHNRRAWAKNRRVEIKLYQILD